MAPCLPGTQAPEAESRLKLGPGDPQTPGAHLRILLNSITSLHVKLTSVQGGHERDAQRTRVLFHQRETDATQ